MVLKRDIKGQLTKANSFILKERKQILTEKAARKKILREKAAAARGPRDEKLAQITQLVVKGEYRGKERPFPDNVLWAKYLCPTGHCFVCGKYYEPKSAGFILQRHMQVSYLNPVMLKQRNVNERFFTAGSLFFMVSMPSVLTLEDPSPRSSKPHQRGAPS